MKFEINNLDIYLYQEEAMKQYDNFKALKGAVS
jgi:hypothetical protein